MPVVVEWSPVLGTVLGGFLAAISGFAVMYVDRLLERRFLRNDWYRRLYRQSIRLPQSTDKFMKLTDKQTQIAHYLSVADALETEIGRSPSGANNKILNKCENVILKIRQINHRDKNIHMKRHHSRLVDLAAELQYLVEQEIDESHPSDLPENVKQGVKERLKKGSEELEGKNRVAEKEE
jgi:hypothetical protein